MQVVGEPSLPLRTDEEREPVLGFFVGARDGGRVDEMVRPGVGERLVEDQADGDRERGELVGVGRVGLADAAEDFQRLGGVVVGREEVEPGVPEGRLLGQPHVCGAGRFLLEELVLLPIAGED